MGITAIRKPPNDPSRVAQDAAAIAAVHIRSWQQAYRALLPEVYLTSLDETFERRSVVWREAIESGPEQVLVAIERGQLVGWVACSQSRDADATPGRTGEVQGIYLLADHWGTGIGLALWLAARAELIGKGFDELTLWVLTDNARAVNFYRNAGLAAEPESVRSLSRGGRTLTEIRYRSHL